MTEYERQVAEAFSIYGTPRTYQEVIQEDGITVDGTTRKRRIVETLDGTPSKGTVVVVCRGTKDLHDLASDMSFGAIVAGTEADSLESNTYYTTEIRPHVQAILTTQFTKPGSDSYSYKQNWDVFATGHSLGGALAEQLIMDGFCKGGLSFAAPRTTRSDRNRPAYSLISAGDMVIARTANAEYSRYDFANPEYTRYKLDKNGNVMETAFHGHDVMSLGTIESTDGGPLWNNQGYYDMDIKINDNVEFDPISGGFPKYLPPKSAVPPKGESGAVENDPTDTAPDPDSTVSKTIIDTGSKLPGVIRKGVSDVGSKIYDIGSNVVKGVTGIAEKAKNYIRYGNTEDVEERGSGRKRGAGPAPKADYLRRMVRDIYKASDQTLQNVAEKGLELPEYRYYKKAGNKKVSCQFYIISTPINIVDYYRMPVFKVIKQQIVKLNDQSDPDTLLKYITLLEQNASI